MEQLTLFAVLFPVDDPLSRLGSETDPEWLQGCLDRWDDPDALAESLDNLKHDLRDVEKIPDRMLRSWQRTMMSDIKDTIRVVGKRVRELQ